MNTKEMFAIPINSVLVLCGYVLDEMIGIGAIPVFIAKVVNNETTLYS